jgi:hypothetical protein
MIRSAEVSPENIVSSSRRANSRVLSRTMAEATPQSPSFRLQANVGLNTGLTTSSIKPIGVDAPTSNHSDVIFRHNAAYLDMDNLDDSFVTPAKDLKSSTPIPRGQSVVRQLSSDFNLQQSLRSQVDDLAQQFTKISGDLLQQQSEQQLAYEKKLLEQAQAHSAQIRQQQAQLQAVENRSASVEQLLQQSLKQQADSQLLLQKLLQQNNAAEIAATPGGLLHAAKAKGVCNISTAAQTPDLLRCNKTHAIPTAEDIRDQVTFQLAQFGVQQLNNKPTVTSETSKFKIGIPQVPKGMVISRGIQIDGASVLQVVSDIRVIEKAIKVACNRNPATASEWNQYFRQFLAYMADGLYDEIDELLATHNICNMSQFFTILFNKLFPEDLVLEAFDNALQIYMQWTEPVGVERWELITRTLIEYREAKSGKTGHVLEAAIAERMYTQLVRTLHNCTPAASQGWLRILAQHNMAITAKRKIGECIPAALYDGVYETIMCLLRDETKKFGYETVYGHSRANKLAAPMQCFESAASLNLRHMKYTPSTPVKQHSVTGQVGKTYASAVSGNGSNGFQKLADYAPTGIKRTWTWQSKLKPEADPARPGKTLPRVFLREPVPAECTNAKCEYLGDWLDYQGLCTYCQSKDHNRQACSALAIATKNFLEEQERRANAAQHRTNYAASNSSQVA